MVDSSPKKAFDLLLQEDATKTITDKRHMDAVYKQIKDYVDGDNPISLEELHDLIEQVNRFDETQLSAQEHAELKSMINQILIELIEDIKRLNEINEIYALEDEDVFDLPEGTLH